MQFYALLSTLSYQVSLSSAAVAAKIAENNMPYLPTELLSKIFNLCLPEFPEVTEDGELMLPSSLEAPMLLTGVCRRWGEVAVGTPNLWCELSLQVYPEEDWHQRALGYDSWLKRSRGYPLSLALECHDHDSTKLRGLLQPYINQILSLWINIGFHADKPELMLTDLSALRELTMYTRGGVHLAQLIRNLPSTLRSLRVMRFDPNALLFDLNLLSSCNPVWSRLTHITIDVCHSNAILHLLQLAPNLSSLAICISFPKIEALEPFTHPRLESLRIKGYAHQTRLSNLLDALSLPNLRILEFYDISHWPHQELKAFLARSRCCLESLLLGSEVRTTEGQRAEYAVLIPSLEVVVDPSCSGVFGPYEWFVGHSSDIAVPW